MNDLFDLSDGASSGPDSSYMDGLNEAQRDAVEAIDGPVLVLAGAGTGKTRVLTTRLAHILSKAYARPYEVLAVTFTNRAAQEMRRRVQGLVGLPVEGWWVGTFHALGARILRSHAEIVGLRSNFTILDSDDQLRLLKQILEGVNLDEKRWPARAVLGVIQRFKDRGLLADAVSEAEGADAAEGKIVDIYNRYQERLEQLNACDFGDLLLHNLTLFARDADVLERYQRQFRYILVDEYQDTNIAQYLWLRLLAKGHGNICCVGDDDQAIYSWRGAEVGNILRFEKDFPGAQVVRLERNYRSTSHILAAAGHLIAHNDGRLGKTLWTEDNPGEKLHLHAVWDGEAEARRIGQEIEAILRVGGSLNQVAILVRAGFQTREFEERLIALGIAYRVIGGPRFYERMEIRDALAYLRVIAQADDDLAFERIVNTPKRGLGGVTLQTLHDLARSQQIPLLQAARRLVETDALRAKARATLSKLLDDFSRWRDQAGSMPHPELTALVLDESGYTAMWEQDKSIEAPGRLENLKELVAGMGEFDSLAEFLEHISLVMENDAGMAEDQVTLMTLHSAKGLEFETVFLPGWEEGLFPHQRALESAGLHGLEEERRLAYVGLTRAKRKAVILHAANRRIYNRWQSAVPSRFVSELPDAHLTRHDEMATAHASPRKQRSRWRFFDRSDGLSRNPAEEARQPLPARYRVGERVAHNRFGLGTVTEVDGDRLGVMFDTAGRIRLVDSFVRKA